MQSSYSLAKSIETEISKYTLPMTSTVIILGQNEGMLNSTRTGWLQHGKYCSLLGRDDITDDIARDETLSYNISKTGVLGPSLINKQGS